MLEEKEILNDTQLNNRVLIIDDDLDFAASLKLILENENYKPFMVHSEEDALKFFAENVVDLALIDIRLGQADGIELLPKLLKIQPNTVCIMVTGFGSIETAIQALRNGAYDFLRKPVNPEELIATLSRGSEKVRLIKERQSREKKYEADGRKPPPPV